MEKMVTTISKAMSRVCSYGMDLLQLLLPAVFLMLGFYLLDLVLQLATD